MKIIKKIDDLGRIAIPKEIRRALRWMGGDEIEISLNDDRSICGGTKMILLTSFRICGIIGKTMVKSKVILLI